MNNTVQVLVHKRSTTAFTIPNGTRAEMENAIADKLRSETEIVWKDDPEGVSAEVITPSGVWRPRKRFHSGTGDRGA